MFKMRKTPSGKILGASPICMSERAACFDPSVLGLWQIMYWYHHEQIFFFPVYDSGSVFSPSVLDITDEDLLKRFTQVNLYAAYS